MNGLTIEELQHFPLGWVIQGYRLIQVRSILEEKIIRVQYLANNENSFSISPELTAWLWSSKYVYDNRNSNQGSTARYRAALVTSIGFQIDNNTKLGGGYRHHIKIPGPKWNREGGLALEITFPKKLSRNGQPCCSLQFDSHWCSKVLEHQFLSDNSSIHLCACGEKSR